MAGTAEAGMQGNLTRGSETGAAQQRITTYFAQKKAEILKHEQDESRAA